MPLSNDEINKVLKENENLIWAQVRKMYRPNRYYDRMDLFQHAWLFARQAVIDFREADGNKLSTVIVTYVWRAIQAYQRKQGRFVLGTKLHRRGMSIFNGTYGDHSISDVDNEELCKFVTKGLSRHDKKLLRDVYIKGMEQKNIAKERGCTKQNITIKLRKIREGIANKHPEYLSCNS